MAAVRLRWSRLEGGASRLARSHPGLTSFLVWAREGRKVLGGGLALLLLSKAAGAAAAQEREQQAAEVQAARAAEHGAFRFQDLETH